MNEFNLGDKVQAKVTLRRRNRWASSEGVNRNIWERDHVPVVGIVVQTVTLSNGFTRLIEDHGHLYTPEQHIRAVKIAYDINRRPVLAPVEEVEVIA